MVLLVLWVLFLYGFIESAINEGGLYWAWLFLYVCITVPLFLVYIFKNDNHTAIRNRNKIANDISLLVKQNGGFQTISIDPHCISIVTKNGQKVLYGYSSHGYIATPSDNSRVELSKIIQSKTGGKLIIKHEDKYKVGGLHSISYAIYGDTNDSQILSECRIINTNDEPARKETTIHNNNQQNTGKVF